MQTGAKEQWGGGAARRPCARWRWAVLGVALWAAVLESGCERSPAPRAAGSTRPTPSGGAADGAIELPQADQRLCTGVVLLIDTSGSMAQSVQDQGGAQRPKHVIARDALQRIVDYTNTWKTGHPDRTLQLGIYHFSSSVREVLPLTEFVGEPAKSAVGRFPPPGGGTAIGLAIQAGFNALYASGCVRKYIVCITDGQNTSGPPPDRIARQLHAQTGGDVELHFVAFDTSAAQFGFLSGVNGTVVEAADGAQLQARLAEIYEKRILAEAMSAEQP